MSHPALGLPPADPTAGLPDAAVRLRAERARLAAVGLQAALKRDPGLAERYDELGLRRLLRDSDRHLEQLAQALETGEARFVTSYAEWLQPIYRRRKVPARDQRTLLLGLRDASSGVLSPAELDVLNGYVQAWVKVLAFHQRLPGDHPGNPAVRFIWKGAGILDDSII
jgi:hypothetical protein